MDIKAPDHQLIGSLVKIIEGKKIGENMASLDVNEVASFLSTLLDEIPGGFFIYRADGDEQMIYENKAVLRIMGCDTHEEFMSLCGGTFRGFVHPEDLEEVEKAISEQIEESQYDLDYVEYRIIRKDGEVRWLEDYGHFIHDEKLGDFFYVFINDSTEKIKKLRKERADIIEGYDNERRMINTKYLRRLEVIKGLSENFESILYVDVANDMTVGYRLSERTRDQFSHELDERTYSSFVESYINRWVHPDDKKKVEGIFDSDKLRRRLNDQKYFIENYRCICEGEIQHMQVQIARVYEETAHAVVGFRKVDEEIKRQMQQKQILEDALNSARLAAEAKNAFLSNMSHDMHTPLNAVLGYVKLLRQQKTYNDVVDNYLNKIEDAAGQVLELTEKVLTISATVESSANIENKCELDDVIDAVYDALCGKAKAKGVHLSVLNKSGTVVTVDDRKLQQIIYQLVDNAIKYTDKGGEVKISVKTELGANGFAICKFSVEDTGRGISKQFMPKLFDPFERESNTTISGSFGSGLGLTLVKRYVDEMGGKIEIDSTVGKGSLFTVTFSLRCDEKRSGYYNRDEALEEIKKRKILIVEDNELNLEIERILLEERGFSVDSAANGKIAIEKLHHTPDDYYALVLMDIQMPVMDGWEATVAIRNMDHPVVANIPIIAVSANSLESDVARSAKAGMDAHIGKPLDVDKLIETMLSIYHMRKSGNKSEFLTDRK